MKNKFLLSLCFGSALSFSAIAQEQKGRTVEVPIDHLFTVSEGFDTNDNIQVVAIVTLPNLCYQRLSRPMVSINEQTFQIRVATTAYLRTDGECAQADKLPKELQMPTRHEKVIDMEEIPTPGTYTVSYLSQDGMKSRKMNVAVAPVAEVDSLQYALVTNAFVEPVIDSEAPEFEVRVTGSLSSSCAELKDKGSEELIKIDDVFVALLEVQISDEICLPTTKPFYKVYKVKNPGVGQYLLHARSMGGYAHNKVFKVEPKVKK